MNPFQRPPFDAGGEVVARRALPIGARTYAPGEALSSDDRAQLPERLLATLWQQGVIDTLPSDAELERLTAPAKPKPQPPARR